MNQGPHGWLGVLGPGYPTSGAHQYARTQARLLSCPYYTYRDYCLADVLIVNVGGCTDHADHGAILEHLKLRATHIIIDAHDPVEARLWSGLAHGAIAHSATASTMLRKKFDIVANLDIPAPPCDPTIGQRVVGLRTEYKVGWYGLWRPYKGLKRLLRAAQIVRDNGLNIGVMAMGAMGDKSYPLAVRQHADALRMSADFSCDFLPRSLDDAAASLANCDLFCLPYHKPDHTQHQSGAAAFLLGLGRPVLVSPDRSFDGVRNYCFTVPDGTAEQFATWVRAFLIDAGLYKEYVIKAASFQATAVTYTERFWAFLGEALR